MSAVNEQKLDYSKSFSKKSEYHRYTVTSFAPISISMRVKKKTLKIVYERSFIDTRSLKNFFSKKKCPENLKNFFWNVCCQLFPERCWNDKSNERKSNKLNGRATI